MAEGEPLTIIAGGGPVPAHVAAAAVKAGRPVFVVGIRGEADPAIAAFPHEFLSWGELGRLDEISRAMAAVTSSSSAASARGRISRGSASTLRPCAASRISWRS